MLNYIHADLHRIFRRPSRLAFIILVFAVALGIQFHDVVSKSYNSVNLTAAAPSLFEIAAIISGIIEIKSVFADDFQAKTMQIAIGLGISRPKVVLVKLIDFAVLSLVDALVFMLLFIICSICVRIHLLGDQLYLLVVTAVGDALFMTLAAAFTMIPVFYLQSAGFAVLFFLIISLDPIGIILSFFGTKEIVMNLHLLELPYSTVVNTLTTQLSLRNAVPIPQMIGVVIYLAVGYGLTVLAFKNRELDF